MTQTVTHQPVYDQSNGWHEMLPTPPPAEVLVGSTTCDYLVIGGGYSGLAATRRLAELDPSSSIVLIEGGRIGNNAAGRSSGFAIDHAHNLRASSFADNRQEALDAIELNREGLAYLDRTIRDRDISCGWTQEGKFHAAASKRGERMLQRFAKSLDDIDEDHRWVDADECRREFGTSYYSRAIHAPHSYLVQPAAMVRGLAQTMPPNVSVYENSMVASLDYGPPHTVWAGSGSIRAQVIVLATNGFTEGFGFLKNRLIPVITWASITRELSSSESDAIGGSRSYGIIAAHPAGTSIRRVTVPNNRIIVRNIFSFSKNSDFVERKQWASRTHRTSLDARWPSLSNVPFEHSWGGALSMSRNGEPVFGELRPGVFGAVVHNGVGIARGTASGKLLAESILGHVSPLVEHMRSKGRPNRSLPLQDLGVVMNTRARRIIAGAEE